MPTEGTYYTQENLQPGDWAIVPLPRAESPADLGERAMQLVLILARMGEGDATTFLTIDTNFVVVKRTTEGLFPQCTEGSARHPKIYAVMPQRPPCDEAFIQAHVHMRAHLLEKSDDTSCSYHQAAEEALNIFDLRALEGDAFYALRADPAVLLQEPMA
jgi:hypothetical protein